MCRSVFRDVIELFANQRIQGGAMSRGGSFDRSGAGQELYVGWRKRREVVPSNTDLIQGFKEPTNVQPSCLGSIQVHTTV